LLRLVVLDSQLRRDVNPGELDADRLSWLDAELAQAPGQPTVVALHHAPISTGSAVWDKEGLPAADRQALGDVLARHRQVRRVVAGHVHRTISGELAGRAALVVPSTYVQIRLSLGSVETAAEPAGFAVHALLDGELASHVQPVTGL
jgi:3',5'-cyclic AMP phosphodiesterase CpdA